MDLMICRCGGLYVAQLLRRPPMCPPHRVAQQISAFDLKPRAMLSVPSWSAAKWFRHAGSRTVAKVVGLARRELNMRALKIALAVAFVASGTFAVSSITFVSGAEAKAHVTPGKPGKCGVGKYYSKKDKGCVAK